MKKKIVLLILLSLIIFISGCRSKEESSASIQNNKGRYMENEISLPEGLDENVTLTLTKKNGMPYLNVFTGEEQCTITGYQMNDDGTWTEDTSEWLKSLSFSSSDSYRNVVLEDASGNQYLYYTEILNDSYKGNILHSTDGTTYETLNPEGWEDKNPEHGTYTAPEKVAMLKDGTLVSLFFSGEVDFYNKEDLSIQYSITGNEYSTTILTVSENTLILGQIDNNYNITGVDVYDIDNNYKKTSYPFQSNLTGNAFLDINNKGDLVLCNPDGVNILEHGTTLWQNVLDGTLTSLTMQNMWSIGFVAGVDDNYYILYNSENAGYSMKKYIYNETIDSVPSTELTVYSLKDNSTLRHAAAVFQQNNPDVKVSFTIAMTDDEYEMADDAIKEDYIRALNVELLAGGGTDILVLDGLPTDSFIEKGVLTDISSIIQPMIDNGKLFSNIMNQYINNGKIYHVPIRFSLPLLCGRNSDVENLSTLDALADYATNHMDTSLFGNMTLDDFLTTFSPFVTDKIIDNDGSIRKDKLILVLNQLKIIGDNCGIVDEYSDEIRKGNNIWDLASQIQLSLNSCAGFKNSMFPLGIVTYAKGGFTLFENAYTPSCELGINNASSHQELSQDFISFVLSEEIGKNDFYDGFSVNKQALAMSSQFDRSNASAYSEIENEDGTFSGIKFGPLNKEQIEDLVNTCSRVSYNTDSNERFIALFKEESKEFFQGSLSVDETADNFVKKISVYLSE